MVEPGLCERVEAANLRQQVLAFARLAPQVDARVWEIAGGVAALSLPEFGRKLNHVTGVGMTQPLTAAALEELEAAYAQRATPLEIDVCPYALPETWQALAARGYVVNAFANTYALALGAPLAAAGEQTEFNLRLARAEEHERLIALSVAGFAAQPKPRARELLEALARTATQRADTCLFVAEHAGQPIASAALALFELEPGTAPAAHLFLASTLPEYRGRGAQTALVRARLQEAQRRGAAVATLTARLGTSSARNAARAGFALVYSKPTFRVPSATAED